MRSLISMTFGPKNGTSKRICGVSCLHSLDPAIAMQHPCEILCPCGLLCVFFFSVQRLLAFARSFNTFSCMLLGNSKLANYCIHIAAFWLEATKVNWYGTCT